ncbi:hypothetical protein ABBQ38_006244 [Trebouxia sp. C0009 RCD-2024]
MAQDPLTSLDNAETAYIDMQMSRLADVTERIDKAEKYLTILEESINSTEKHVGVWVSISYGFCPALSSAAVQP